MRELAHLVSRLDMPELTVEIQEHVEQHLRGAPSRVCPDINKARERLGYAAHIDLEEGLSRLLRWYQAG
jgi:nucleoside-diphosphate-sugar epimerase